MYGTAPTIYAGSEIRDDEVSAGNKEVSQFGIWLISARKMLSVDRDNLNLWYAYAALEISRHRYQAARSVFATALTYAKTRRVVPGEYEYDLLAGWVQMESDLGETDRAVDLLLAEYDSTYYSECE